MKILTVGVELFPAGGRTDGQKDRGIDMKKLRVAFRNSANVSQNSVCYPHSVLCGPHTGP